jgi:hypothetical protein
MPQHLCGGTKKNHRYHKSDYLAQSEPRTSKIQCWSANDATATSSIRWLRHGSVLTICTMCAFQSFVHEIKITWDVMTCWTFQTACCLYIREWRQQVTPKTLIVTNQHRFIAQKTLILMHIFIYTVNVNNYHHSCA